MRHFEIKSNDFTESQKQSVRKTDRNVRLGHLITYINMPLQKSQSALG
jgi:hypothetical protein